MQTQNEIWMISNRQPWVWALTEGLITSKTRSMAVHLPPVGSFVFLHASKALWSGWKYLWWAKDIREELFPRGGVVAVARVKAVGQTDQVMPDHDYRYFYNKFEDMDWLGGYAGPQTIVFRDIKPIEFIPCRGSQVPTRKLPPGVSGFVSKHKKMFEVNSDECPSCGKEHPMYSFCNSFDFYQRNS